MGIKMGVVIVYCVDVLFKDKLIILYIKMNKINIDGLFKFIVWSRVVFFMVNIVFKFVYLKNVINCVVKNIRVIYSFMVFMFFVMVLIIFLLFFMVLVILL